MTNGEKIKEIFPNTKIITQYDNPFGDRFMVFKLNNETMQVNLNWWNAEYKEPTTNNDLAVDCICRAKLLKAMDTWDKFGNDPNEGLIPLRTPALQDRYVLYVKYDDMVNCVKGMPPVTPQEPKTGHWIDKDEKVAVCSCCNRNNTLYGDFCKWCGAKMVEPQESEEKE